MSRPSKHNPITKSYAIDQIEDIEQLRAVAHRMWEAFAACHSQSAHMIASITYGACGACLAALTKPDAEPCEQYMEWQKAVTDGFGSV